MVYSDTCSHSLAMFPAFKVAKRENRHVQFMKTTRVTPYIMYLPTFIVTDDNGEIIDTWSGSGDVSIQKLFAAAAATQ